MRRRRTLQLGAAMAPEGPPPGTGWGDGIVVPWTRILKPYGYDYEPDDDLAHYKLLTEVPTGIVIHSGAKSARVGPYIINDPTAYAYHAAWFPGRGIVQTAPLNLRVSHGGVGNCWFGLGLSGPYGQDPRSAAEVADLIRFCVTLKVLFAPRMRFWCGHQDYDANKKDPGPGVTTEIMASAGLEWSLPPGAKLAR